VITGSVRRREARVTLTLRDRQGTMRPITAVVDTGNVFPLTLPAELFEEFGFGYLRDRRIGLADGSERATPALDIEVLEFGPRVCTAILLPGRPLLGMGLLKRHRLTIDAVEGGRVLIEPLGREVPG
jgi:predicted aspartyl protease